MDISGCRGCTEISLSLKHLVPASIICILSENISLKNVMCVEIIVNKGKWSFISNYYSEYLFALALHNYLFDIHCIFCEDLISAGLV